MKTESIIGKEFSAEVKNEGIEKIAEIIFENTMNFFDSFYLFEN
jgi:hypothetical protein